MEITVKGEKYQFEIDNFFGPAYLYQAHEGEAVVLNGDILVPFKLIYGAILLHNDHVPFTFKEMLGGISDSEVSDLMTYVTSRMAELFTDKEQEKEQEDAEGED